MLVIDDLPAPLQARLQSRAAENRRSPHEELLAILQAVLEPLSGAQFVAEMQALGQEAGITDDFEIERDRTPPRDVTFE